MKISRIVPLFLAVTVMATAAQAGESLTGTFKGASRHKTSGQVTLSGDAKGAMLTLAPDFRFDGAPDPKLALGHNGFDKKTMFSKLKSNSGAQTYRLPAGIDPSKYNEVWVWCETYNVPLGKAKLR